MSAEKVYLRNKESGLSELLPLKYKAIFPDLFEEVRNGKPVEPSLHTPASKRKKSDSDLTPESLEEPS